MVQDLRKICVLSGPSVKVDLSRARSAIRYHASLDAGVPFKILGAGPDLREALQNNILYRAGGIEKTVYQNRMQSLDHHLALFQTLKDTEEEVETVTSSVTLVQNVLHGFKEEQDGRYGIATDNWHYGKFEKVADSLKGKGRISEGLEFFNIESDGDYYSWIQRRASEAKTWLELMRV